MSEPIIFWYKNWRGEERHRHATPISLRYGSSEWHKAEQWLMLARDEETGEEREFALADMRHTVGSPTLTFSSNHDAPQRE